MPALSIRVRLLAAGSLAVVLATSPASGDITPACCQFDSDVTCAASDVGNVCPSGGTCLEAQCDQAPVFIYKCLQCPPLVADPGSQCVDNAEIGKPCGDGGICTPPPQYCRSLPGYTLQGTVAACHGPPDGSVGLPYGTCTVDASAPDAASDATLPEDAAPSGDGASTAEAGAADDAGGSSEAAPPALSDAGTHRSPDAGTLAAAGRGSSGGCSASKADDGGLLAGLLMIGGCTALLLERRRSR